MKKIVFKLLIWFFICLIVILGAVLGLGYLKYKEAIRKTTILNRIQELRNNDNYTNLKNISDDYKHAVVAIEDHRFYSHKGVDYLSVFRSTYINFKRKSLDYGASTITQQVRKAYVFFSRKISYKEGCRNICSI